MTPQETQPDLPMGVQGSAAEAWVGGGLLQGWGTACSSECMGPLEGGRHYLHYLHHSLDEEIPLRPRQRIPSKTIGTGVAAAQH